VFIALIGRWSPSSTWSGSPVWKIQNVSSLERAESGLFNTERGVLMGRGFQLED
jgi:hypothetical protein